MTLWEMDCNTAESLLQIIATLPTPDATAFQQQAAINSRVYTRRRLPQYAPGCYHDDLLAGLVGW